MSRLTQVAPFAHGSKSAQKIIFFSQNSPTKTRQRHRFVIIYLCIHNSREYRQLIPLINDSSVQFSSSPRSSLRQNKSFLTANVKFSSMPTTRRCSVWLRCFRKFFNHISQRDSCLHHILPPPRDTLLVTWLRHAMNYPVQLTKTKRFRSFTNYALTNDCHLFLYAEYMCVLFLRVCDVCCILLITV